MDFPEEVLDLFALQLVPGLGPRLVNELLKRFHTAERVFAATREELQQVPHIGPKVAAQLKDAFGRLDVEAEWKRIRDHGVTLLHHDSSDYPARLRQIDVPPNFLYTLGTLEPRDNHAVAIVGSRNCTAYGRRIAARIAGDLARRGVTVVSGLARGIDAMAHRGALDAGGRTLAVMACGLAHVYPPEHSDLAQQLVQAGALLSESQMQMEPMSVMFPARNRIISGLSQAVVLIEAADKSGALITARHASEQGRDVLAVPGPVDCPANAGTLRLLRQGAKLVRNADDILEEIDGFSPTPSAAPTPTADPKPSVPQGLDPNQLAIWKLLDQQQSVDALAQHLALPISQLNQILMTMEMRRLVRRMPGNVYQRS